MAQIACFGEILLRFSPSANGGWIAQHSMPAYIAGAELNVAQALQLWKLTPRVISALPQNAVADDVVHYLNEKGIDTSGIMRSGERLGIYYLPQGSDLKSAGVIYDRSASSFAGILPGETNWEEVLTGCTWLHISAITPALNSNSYQVCVEVAKAASKLGIRVSIDLNYRSRLWQYGVDPITVMPELVQYCKVVMGNLWSVQNLLGIASPLATSEGATQHEMADAASRSMAEVKEHYPAVEQVAYTFRLPQTYFGVYHTDRLYQSPAIQLRDVRDQVGSGDCFMAGLIYGLFTGQSPQDVIDFAAAAAVNKLSELGDATSSTREQIISKHLDAH